MAENKLIIGSLPVLRGAYDSATNYYRDNQVTMYGSTFQSLVDENVGYPPAELREDGKVYAINTDKWIIVANAIDAYNAGERIANAEARIKELGEYADSPEFIRVYTDTNGKFLWGIRANGTVEWAKGVPTPIQNALQELADKIKDFSGEIDDVETALNEKIEALQDAIDVINASLKPLTDTFSFQDNEEFAHVITDADGKVLFGIKTDGSPYYPHNEMYHVIQNEEYLAAWMDASGKLLFGIKADGSTYIAKSEYIDAVKEIQGKLLDIKAITENFEIKDNPEYISTTVDSERKVLEGTLTDGKKYFAKQALLDKYDDPEFMSAVVDKNGKVLEGITSNGKKVVYTDVLLNGETELKHAVIDDISLKNEALTSLQNQLDKGNVENPYLYRNFNVPRYGKVNIITHKADPEVLEDVDDPMYHYNEEGNIVYDWPINKDKHKCTVEIDFGDFLKGTFYTEVSFQGSSTLVLPKKNFRIKFYKDDTYDKSDKVKIGELCKSSGFNIKSYYQDGVVLKEPLLNRLILEARYNRDYDEQFPWNTAYYATTSATGTILSFPVLIEVDDDFYGVGWFGNKKDEANYMLDGDETGMVVSGDNNLSWLQFNSTSWVDEMNDEITESNITALQNFWTFINSDNFNKDTVPQRLGVIDWIDYYIFITVFRMRDNDIHNLILYSGSDKQKFYPFLYDLDLSIDNTGYDVAVDQEAFYGDNLAPWYIWKRLKELYWEEICDRYWELRKSVLNYSHICNITTQLQASIPYDDLEDNYNKWGRNSKSTSGLLSKIKSLLGVYDEYFNY